MFELFNPLIYFASFCYIPLSLSPSISISISLSFILGVDCLKLYNCTLSISESKIIWQWITWWVFSALIGSLTSRDREYWSLIGSFNLTIQLYPHNVHLIGERWESCIRTGLWKMNICTMIRNYSHTDTSLQDLRETTMTSSWREWFYKSDWSFFLGRPWQWWSVRRDTHK